MQVGQRNSQNGGYDEKANFGALSHRQALLRTQRDERANSEGVSSW